MEMNGVVPISSNGPKVASSVQIRVATLFGTALFGAYLARRTAKALNLPAAAQTSLLFGIGCTVVSLAVVLYIPGLPAMVSLVFCQVVPMNGFFKHSLLNETQKQLAENRVSPLPWRDVLIVIVPLNIVVITVMIINGL